MKLQCTKNSRLFGALNWIYLIWVGLGGTARGVVAGSVPITGGPWTTLLILLLVYT